MKKIFLTILFLVLSYHNIPGLIHKINLYFTLDSEIIENRKQYNNLQLMSYRNHDEQMNIEKQSKQLFLWFHIRGLPIDEGHHTISSTERWREFLIWLE